MGGRSLPESASPQITSEQPFLVLVRLHPACFSLLGNKLGPILVQLPPTFGYHNLYALRGLLGFLRDSAQELEFAIEFRNASLLQEDILSLLHEHDMALCLNDLEWMPPSHDTTTHFAYFRWLGRPPLAGRQTLEPLDVTHQLIASLLRVRGIASRVEEVYGFFNDRYGGHAPWTVNLVKEILGLSPVDPRSLWPQQLTMFEE